MPTDRTNNRLNDISSNYDKIFKVIQSLSLGPNKNHGHDGVSVKMLKLSCPSLIKPLLLIIRNCLNFGTFPDNWKKGNVIAIHKKDN